MGAIKRIVVYGLFAAAACAAAVAILAGSSRPAPLGAQEPIPAADSTTEAFTERDRGPDDGDDSNDVARFSTPGVAPEKRAGARVYLAVRDLGPGDGRAIPPDTAATSTLFRFGVDPLSTAGARFHWGRGLTLNCADNRGCDLDPGTDRLLVRLDVAGDAADGTQVIVNLENLIERRATRFVVPVIGDRLAPSALRVELADGSSASRPADGSPGVAGDEAVFRVMLEDNRSPPSGFPGERLVVTATGGAFRSSGFGTECPRAGVARCELTTDANGGWIQLRGDGEPGVARLTFRAAGFTVTRDVTFYGEARSIAAAAEQGAVSVGGSVFVVVTVTDAAGNGISGRTPALGSGADAVRGPRSGAVAVTAVRNAPKDIAGSAGDIPACSAGTDASGRCVMRVTAPDPPGTANDAARGTHTVTVVGADPIPAAGRKAAVTVTVVGPADRIAVDAPGRMQPGAVADIALTVTDDRGVRVGAQSVLVTRTAGGGSLVGAGPAVTRDGRHAFSYRADRAEGVADFLAEVRALDGDGAPGNRVLARTRFTIRIGSGIPAAGLSSLRPVPSGPGYVITIFGGGPVSSLGALLLSVCSNEGVAAYANGPNGRFLPYLPNARVQAANGPFRALFPRGIPALTGLIIGNCDR